MRLSLLGVALLGAALSLPVRAEFVFRTAITPPPAQASCAVPEYLGGGSLRSGQSLLAYSEYAAPQGMSCASVAVVVTCKEGRLRQNGGVSRTCEETGPLACALPPYLGGGTLASGANLPRAYLVAQPAPGRSCSDYAVPVTCNNGELQHNGATSVTCADPEADTHSPRGCPLPWGGELAHGTVHPQLVYSAAHVQHPATCDTVAVQLSCNNGQLSPPAPYKACRVKDPHFSEVSLLLPGGPEGEVTGKAPVSGGEALVTDFAKVGKQSIGMRSGAITLAGAPLAFGQSDFTVETWIYLVSAPPSYANLWSNNGGALGTLGMRFGDAGNGHRLQLLAGSPSSPIDIGGLTKMDFVGQWRHLAVTRVHGEIRAYVDGRLKVAVQRPINFIGAGLVLGAPQFTGHFNELRATARARYLADFVPATIPFPAE